jgi:hypothetical protein
MANREQLLNKIYQLRRQRREAEANKPELEFALANMSKETKKEKKRAQAVSLMLAACIALIEETKQEEKETFWRMAYAPGPYWINNLPATVTTQ